MKKFLPLLMLVACSGPKAPTFEAQQVGTDALLQAISIVDENTVWLSGHKATFVRTIDGGVTWDVFQHPTGDTLQFRDVHAFDAHNIVLMSAGSGPLSRIFKVKDGKEWAETFVMQDSLGFLDCIDFWDGKRGIAYGDAIDNFPYILLTDDGGESWSRADKTQMPNAGKGEGGFAASGTCVTTGADGLAWIASGASGNARILFTADYGKNWQSFASPMVKGDAAGHTSVSFVDSINGFVTGGDLALADRYTNNCAFTTDGGKTWKLTSQPVTKGAFYGGKMTKEVALTCGPNGMDYTLDRGQTWTQLDSANYWAVAMHPDGFGWASGKGGRVVKINLE
jgi:photosystem II stability/assembly factor-like uncharacterized protein